MRLVRGGETLGATIPARNLAAFVEVASEHVGALSNRVAREHG